MNETRTILALLKCAAHCQGGHSDAGAAAADVLGVPFPLRMEDLVPRARQLGHNPAKVWPWLITMGEGEGADHRYFHRSEIAEALAG